MSIDTLDGEKSENGKGMEDIMKFFNPFIFNEKHWEYVKNDRKIFVDTKLINYNGVQREVYLYEKGIRILPADDEIIQDLQKHVYDFDMDITVKEKDGTEKVIEGNYIFDYLSKNTKKYLRSVDMKFFRFDIANMISKGSQNFIYDEREERLMKRYPMLNDMSDDEVEQLYNKYVLVGQALPLEIENKIYQTYRRTTKTIKELAITNCKDFKYFVTLTFAENENKEKHEKLNALRDIGEKEVIFNYVGSGYDNKVTAFTVFMHNFKKKLKKKYGIDLKYIVVPEEHRNGEIHYHALISDIPIELTYKTPQWLDYDFIKQCYNNGDSMADWKHGKSDIQLIKNQERVSTYLSKYMIKNYFEIDQEHYEKYLHRKRYFNSTNLVRPTSEYVVKKEELDELFKEVSETSQFISSYTNPYNGGKITRSILN